MLLLHQLRGLKQQGVETDARAGVRVGEPHRLQLQPGDRVGAEAAP